MAPCLAVFDRCRGFGMLPTTGPADERSGAGSSTRMANQFFFIFLATIAFTRIALFLHPVSAPTIGLVRTHHYMYGALLALFGLAGGIMPVFAVGMGLFVDELTYVMMGGRTHQDNYSSISLVGTLLLVLVVFVLRRYLVGRFDT